MLHQQGEPRTIEISQNHEYFFAICARKRHSHVMVGVKDNDTHEFYHLFSIGKFFVLKNSSLGASYLKMFFSTTRTRLRMETLYYDDDTTGEFGMYTDVFSYKAYDFTAEEYLRFLDHVRHCDARTSYIYAYQRVPAAPDQQANKTIFKYLPVERNPGQKPLFNGNASFNSINNSCRDTAIEMTLDAKNMPEDTALPTSCFSALPYAGWINKGRLNNTFLVFPLPPEQRNMDPSIYSLLKITYDQLETVPKNFDTNNNTYLKFNAIKELYMLLDRNKNYGMNELFSIIINWENKYRHLIDYQRGFAWFSQTATRKMVDDLKEIINWNTPRMIA